MKQFSRLLPWLLVALLITSGVACTPEEHPNSHTSIHSYFSPGGGAQAAFLREIGKAKSSINVAMYYFTNRDLADALIAAQDRGLTIRVVLDRSQTRTKWSQAKYLASNGIPVLIDNKHRIMHHKFAIIDRDVLITGSQNWTISAETKNAENTLVIKNNRYLVAKYLKNFDAIAAECRELKNYTTVEMAK